MTKNEYCQMVLQSIEPAEKLLGLPVNTETLYGA